MNNVLIELHGIITPTDLFRAENNTSANDKQDRTTVIINNIKKWEQIYNQGFKYDIFYTDNSDFRFYFPFLIRFEKATQYTNTWINHWNKNPISEMIAGGGEKSGVIMAIRPVGGGMAEVLGYDAVLHFNARYEPDVDYDWKSIVDMFIKEDLDLLITPSRFNKPGFNPNCMLVKPSFWIEWIKHWHYTPSMGNNEMMDCYKSLTDLGLIYPDKNYDTRNWGYATEEEARYITPFAHINKKRMRLWIEPPYEWFRGSASGKYIETEEGYQFIPKNSK